MSGTRSNHSRHEEGQGEESGASAGRSMPIARRRKSRRETREPVGDRRVASIGESGDAHGN